MLYTDKDALRNVMNSSRESKSHLNVKGFYHPADMSTVIWTPHIQNLPFNSNIFVLNSYQSKWRWATIHAGFKIINYLNIYFTV